MTILRLMRPLQWSKNIVIFIALIFSRKIFVAQALSSSGQAFFSFCLLASGVYAFNDVVDMKRDRRHSSNRHRPVAAGHVAPITALALALALWAAGVLVAMRLSPQFAAVALLYVGNSMLYCLLFKRAVILDVISIVFGFFLRIAAGAAAIGVAVSHWLVVCAISFSLFLAFCKRRAEMSRGEEYKEVLSLYTKPMIEQMISISAGLALLSYMLYTIAPETVAKFNTDRLVLTVPFVVYGVFRYLYLAYKERLGENPSRALIRDVPSLVNGALYASMVYFVLYRR